MSLEKYLGVRLDLEEHLNVEVPVYH